MFRGDVTDKVEDFLKSFDQYVSIVQIKKQQLDVLLYHLEGRARWYLDSVSPQPKYVDEAKVALTTKFKQDVTVKLNLSVTSHINCIVARCLINVVYLTACFLYQILMTLHFLNDVANDAESTQKSKITSYSLV